MHAKEKEQSHAQDNIYVVWQFVYVHDVVGVSLLSEKKIQSVATVFPLTQKHDHKKEP